MLQGVTLDQLRFLLAVVDEGSFTAAARSLDRAQSAVSHAVATLEHQLDLQLFDRSTRRPTLTPAGEAIATEARGVLVRAERLKARASQLASGVEGELSYASGVIVPEDAFFDATRYLSEAYPGVLLTMFREELGGPLDLLERGLVKLAFTGTLDLARYPEDTFEKVPVGTVDVLSVASPDHALARLGRALSDSDLAGHRQLVPISWMMPRYRNTLVHNVWSVADVKLRTRFIAHGLGWGTVPTALVRPWIEDGRLVELKLQARPHDALRVPLFACWRTGDALGPAAKTLVRLMTEALARPG